MSSTNDVVSSSGIIDMYDDEAILHQACETPLPGYQEEDTDLLEPATPTMAYATHGLYISPRTPKSTSLLLPSISSPPVPATPLRKRRRNLNIFIDSEPRGPTPKRAATTKKVRVPLGTRVTVGNDTPISAKFPSDTPFALRATDPFWEDTENYNRESPAQGIVTVAGRVAVEARKAPINTLLYDVLNLKDWRAGNLEIQYAYRQALVDATKDRELIEAAAATLLDTDARKTYHDSGKFQWDL